MKEEFDDTRLEELFRHKLEMTEIEPSGSSGPSLMKALGRREFLHFIPSKVNIWYLAGAVAAGTALAIVLMTGTANKNESENEIVPLNPVESPATGVNTPDISASTADEKPGTILKVLQPETGTKTRTEKVESFVTKEIPAVTEEKITAPENIKESVTDKSIILNQDINKEKLKSSAGSVSTFIQASVIRGCAPLAVRFKSSVTPGSKLRWEFGKGVYSAEKEPVWKFTEEGEYNVQLQITEADGSKTTSSVAITVLPRPVAKFDFSPEKPVIPDDEIVFHNYSANAERYIWDFGDGSRSEMFEPRHTYSKYGNYDIRLIASSESGCTDTAYSANAFGESGYYIKFPNAFIPNPNGPSGGYYSAATDESSHVFHPVYSGVSEYQLRIFSRRGILVFESNDISIGWDGYIKGQLSDAGVYVWEVRGSYNSGEPFNRRGDLTLLRY